MIEDIQAGLSQALTDIPWGQWLSALFLLLLGLLLASLAGRSAGSLLADRASRHQSAMIRRLVFYLVFLLFAMAALREAGFSLDVVLGAAGILTVAVGFASQTSASNMISGLFLLMEKPFQIGDFIEVDATIGEVVGIDLLSVKLRTPDNLYVRIPNETLIKTQVVNRSRFPIRRLDLTVGIAYAEDVERVEALLLQLAERDAICLEEPRPFVLVTDFGPSSVDLQFSYWVPKDKVLEGRSAMMVAIKKALDQEGIEIPFPHTSVYAGTHSAPFRVELLSPMHREKDVPDAEKHQ
ncbi:mechanosensitive ion channel family protein [Marinobacter lutaoensis]|jgi:small-conductance mechanosensitive channel|uniref:mechanosensitive ion channel family protein n=1 Tax=Marinobacter lutaoensis TaxID=135739 RepID=UPI000C091CF1|nr:mechanosensitive ion channel family protein [Marinobacter lutaoensis]MBE02372.1 mechanosensitive ion channel protein [Marinobacter sp.]MBI42574.1 mechanosensitive ion channel protein [Oceanospirillales bacterium]NVD34686.1 mechanosensitive ion channel family protein [Marinobacter lutaoensis]|tara:strand:+ start:1474 stop:2358 length:885 start_codon:yes stop_codon:yes gene_type:complete